jgi:iron-sulfur cluster repair protein YtfE (RIC family)
MGQAAVDVKAERASAPVAQEATGWRVDLYVGVHKGLRALMSDVLATVGRVDAHDPADVDAAMKQVRGLLEACRLHLHKENQFLHPAMEGRRPGSAGPTADDHVHHEQAIEQLESGVLAVERSTGATRAAAALTLYRRLALFVADNYQHMHVEETDNNAVLWAAYTDEELLEIQHALVASIPPQWMAVFLRWMVPAMAPAERAALLTTIQQGAPTEVFERILAAVKPHLGERDWTKLMAALGPVPFGFC